jgi:tetratricopeptide (TPR) repeat protein
VARRPTVPFRPLGLGAVLATCLGLALGGAVPGRADAADFFSRYLEAHPGVEEEDLLEVARGDLPARVLAVVHHPHLGVDPVAVASFEIDGPTLLPVSLERVWEGRASGLPAFVAVRQRCTRPPPGAEEPIFSSWFLFREGRLRAFSLEIYDERCVAEPSLVEAFDHDDMRLIGQSVFRRAGVGTFRYGSLLYERWDDAFADPTRDAMLSRLEAAARSEPEDAGALNRLAVGLYAAGERDRALELLKRAAALAPAWPLVHRNLAVAHLHRGDVAAARPVRERAEALASGEGASRPAPPRKP